MSFDIAIVGLSGRFPGARNIEAFWDLLKRGDNSFSQLSPEDLERAGTPDAQKTAENFVPVACKLDDIESFDAEFFGIPSREALVLDPQHRLFLECVWEAFEDAGLDPARQKAVGVFAGASLNNYLIHNLSSNPHLLTTPSGFLSLVSNEKDYLATRVAYKLDLHGPAVTVQTACSTSLVAVHQAMQSLIFGECDIAVAGGVSVKVPQRTGYLHQPGMPFSEDGTCRSFDANGTGTVFGSGAGVVVLKPLADAIEDGDDIYCVIRGSAMNNDGNRKVGFTAPSTAGQADVIARALAIAECKTDSISYIEAHATATPLGDPIELEALGAVHQGRKAPLRIGSVKSNIGHLETAAGVAGLIKTALMLKHKTLVPSVGFETPNPHADFHSANLIVQQEMQPWSGDGPLRAGVSSFGMGGTNLHMVLEEAPAADLDAAPDRDTHLFVLSARSDAALKALGEEFAAFSAETDAKLGEIASNAMLRRSALSHRQAFLASSPTELAERALHRDLTDNFFGTRSGEAPLLTFGYCGGGAQYPGMAAALMNEPVFSSSITASVEAFRDLLGHDLRPFLSAEARDDLELARAMQAPDIMFPALFAVQNAMGDLMESWGLSPDIILGHSNGEYAAAVRAGIMSVDAARRLVASRSSLMMQMPAGGMISLARSANELADFAAAFDLSVGAVNGPENSALSGLQAQIDLAAAEAKDRTGVPAKTLHVGAALHSHLTKDISDAFAEAVRKEDFAAPKCQWISTVTGAAMDQSKAPNVDYWVRHLTGTVRFREAAEVFLATGRATATLDLGPGRVLGDLLRQNAADTQPIVVQAARSASESTSDDKVALAALAKVWALGADVELARFAGNSRVRKLPLPHYPWQRKRFWIDPPAQDGTGVDLDAALSAQSKPDEEAGDSVRPVLTSPYVAPATETEEQLLDIWKSFLGDKKIGTADDFIELGGTSLLAIEVVNAMNQAFGITLELGVFLEAKTIAATAAAIEPLRQQSEAQLLTEALAEIQGKSDEELAALLQSA